MKERFLERHGVPTLLSLWFPPGFQEAPKTFEFVITVLVMDFYMFRAFQWYLVNCKTCKLDNDKHGF